MREPRVEKGGIYVPVKIGPAAPLQVRVVDEGPREGEPLVLLHGLYSSIETWRGWAERLKATRRIIRIDLPGSGLTGARPDRNYSVEADAKVVSAVLDSLGVRDFSLAGNSLGGYVAWYLAADLACSSRVKKLILISPIGLRAKSGRADRLPAPVRAVSRVFTPRFAVRMAHPVAEDELDAYWALARFDGNAGAAADRLAQPWVDHTPMLELITARTLVIWGAEDHYLVNSDDACCFWHRIPKAQIAVLPGAKHMSMEEQPERTAKLAAEFLEKGRITLPEGARADCARLKKSPRIAFGHSHDDAPYPLPPHESKGGFDEVYTVGEKGRPAILLLHEAPGLTPNTFRLAADIAGKGYRVYVPLMFGEAGKRSKWNFAKLLVDPRFLVWRDAAPPIAKVLTKLAEEIAAESPEHKIGVIGMCLTGNVAISISRRAPGVTATVVSQPAMPFFRPRALGLDRDDINYLKMKDPLSVLYLRFSHDKISPWERQEEYEKFAAIDFHVIDSSPCNPKGLASDAHAVLTTLYDSDGKMIPARTEDFERLMNYLRDHLPLH